MLRAVRGRVALDGVLRRAARAKRAFPRGRRVRFYGDAAAATASDFPQAVSPETTRAWLAAGKVNLLVDVRTLPEFCGDPAVCGIEAPACQQDLSACELGHARIAPYAAGAPWTQQLHTVKNTALVQYGSHTLFAESLASDTDEQFEAIFGADLTGLVIGFMCHDGVNPNDPQSMPRSLQSAVHAAELGARAFTVAGGMQGWADAGLQAQHGEPTTMNLPVAK